MSKRSVKKGRKKHKKAEEDPHSHWFKHFVFGCLGLLIVAYVAVLLLSRTEGCRFIVRDYLEKELGLAITIGGLHVDPSLNIVLENIAASEAGADGECFAEIKEVILKGSLLKKLKREKWLQSVEVIGCGVTVVQTTSGDWKPAPLASMSDWLADWGQFEVVPPPVTEDDYGFLTPGPEKKSEAVVDSASFVYPNEEDKSFYHRMAFKLTGGRIRWKDAYDNELAVADGVSVELTPLPVSAREMQHAIVSIANVRSRFGDNISALFFEVLSTQGTHVLLGHRANRSERASHVEMPPRSKPQPPVNVYEHVNPDPRPEDLQRRFREELSGALKP